MRQIPSPDIIAPHQKVSVNAPSGALRGRESFDLGVKIWRDRGYELVIPDDLSQPWGYLAGNDEQRCHYFNIITSEFGSQTVIILVDQHFLEVI